MVQVVVRDRDDVEAARVFRRERRRHEAVGVRREVRIDEHRRAPEPKEERRLPEPPQRRLAVGESKRRESFDGGGGESGHAAPAGRSSTFTAPESTERSVAKASSCRSSGKRCVTRGRGSKRPLAKSDTTHCQAS